MTFFAAYGPFYGVRLGSAAGIMGGASDKKSYKHPERNDLMEKTTHIEIVLSQHVNGMKRLFGGVLMSWIDVLGGVTARRYAKRDVTTVCIDSIEF